MRKSFACHWWHLACDDYRRRLTAGAEGYDGLVAALGQLGRDDGHEGLECLGVRLNVAPLRGWRAAGFMLSGV